MADQENVVREREDLANGEGDESEVRAVEIGVDDAASEAAGEVVAEAEAEPEEKSLPERLADLERERDEYLDQWRRSAAEFQNFRKREERLRMERERAANARLLRKLLPVLDDLQRAAQHVPDEIADNEWVRGVQAIERKLWNVLEQEGISAIEAEAGIPFDPNVHEALLSQPGDEIEPGHIME
ncbi:MAG: nucleotide exchange factor GrpE, partial [Ardenticatenaceae bacterium]